MKSTVTVFVKLYATLTKHAGVSIMEEPMRVDISAGSTLTDLYSRLGIPADEVKTAFVNSVMQPPEYELRDGDHIGIFPPVGGGAC